MSNHELLAKLIDLFAKQEGVRITYRIETKEKENEKTEHQIKNGERQMVRPQRLY